MGAIAIVYGKLIEEIFERENSSDCEERTKLLGKFVC